MNIPNMLTFFRLAVALVIGWPFLIFADQFAALVAFFLFLVAAITDFLDGYLARKWNQISDVGRMLDPIADKIIVLMVLAIILGVLGLRWFLVLPISIIFFRDILVSGMREFLGDRAKNLAVTKIAKWKTASQMTAISVMLLAIGINSGVLAYSGVTILWAAMVLTLISGIDYVQKAIKLLDN